MPYSHALLSEVGREVGRGVGREVGRGGGRACPTFPCPTSDKVGRGPRW